MRQAGHKPSREKGENRMAGRFYTVSNLDGIFQTYRAAYAAWCKAGKPVAVGSGVWISEYDGPYTIKTTTIF
jgi:GH43 family beta-xylosidase